MQIACDIARKKYLQQKAKERYIANRETMLKVAKEYYHRKKKQLNMKCHCPCGGYFAKQNKPAHLKSKKHSKYEAYVLDCIKDEEILYTVK